ncbi:LppP/LprE family lipoprotein [Streptomyces sp. NPDC049577]|uniref:LppP/LprE family lipoprotein n=1 Tax=Streptomyces sp. NPDC049577 TaxID=3155153 RepID=UPI0034255131
MPRPVGIRAVAMGFCLLLVTACGSSAAGGRPAASPSVLLWSPGAGGGSPSARGDEPFDLDRAVLRVKRLGYTVDDEPAALKKLRGPLRALHGHCTNSADGTCVSVFFFLGNEYAGYDAAGIAQSTIESQDGTTVTLSYPVYAPTDPQCCASGGTSRYRARWQDGKVTFTPPLPANPNHPES